jgi:purine-nucleoside phosphorylase
VSTHIGAAPGDIAPLVLLPGDPLRARWIAETFLEDARCYTEVRGMHGYTGTWNGHPVSVQGSGMGQPSASIYVNELCTEYDVQTIIRVGSCGALTERVGVRDLVLASGACTDSSMNSIRFEGLDYAPVADFGLLRAAHDLAEAHAGGAGVHVGLVFSSDSFYPARPELAARMVEYGVLAVEM